MTERKRYVRRRRATIYDELTEQEREEVRRFRNWREAFSTALGLYGSRDGRAVITVADVKRAEKAADAFDRAVDRRRPACLKKRSLEE